jgi:hypothetical protein
MKHLYYLVLLAFSLVPGIISAHDRPAESQADSVIPVIHCSDFVLQGDGSEPAWDHAEWFTMNQQVPISPYTTRFKIMYSDSGLYCLYQCVDHNITSTLQGDFLDLWHEDVVEAFFWTDERIPVYFEYELSPKNYELVLMVPNYDGNFYGWRPWHYEGKRMTRHAVNIDTGKDDPSKKNSWTAEFFIPYALLKPVITGIPTQGKCWRANFYRIDYDNGQAEWYWLPVPGTFHDYKRFGTLEFR